MVGLFCACARDVRRLLAPYNRVGALRGRMLYYRAALVDHMPIRRLRRLAAGRPTQKACFGRSGHRPDRSRWRRQSTAVKEIARWLGWRVNVHVFHMGTTHPSTITKVIRNLSSSGQGIQAACNRVFGTGHRVTAAASWFSQLMFGLRCLGEAKDRYSNYLALARKRTAQGGVVIYDRYPLAEACIDGRFMDGPRFAASGLTEGRTLVGWPRAEEEIYRRIRPPDHILVMRVSPEVSQERKPEHRRERIDAKAQAIDGLIRDGRNVTEIDADQPLEQVLLQIKAAIWSWV